MNVGRHAPVRAAVSRRPLSAQSKNRSACLPSSHTSTRHGVDRSLVPGVCSEHISPPPTTCPAQYLRPNYVPDKTYTNAANAVKRLKEAEQCGAFISTRQHPARVFMLLCRARGRPVSTPGLLKASSTSIRHYSASSETRTESVDPSINGQNSREPRPRPWPYADASIKQTKDNKPRLEVRIIRNQAQESGALKPHCQTEKQQNIIHEITIPEVKSVSRGARVEHWFARGKQISRAVELQMRQGQSNITWSHVFDRLQECTPAKAHDQSTFTVRGPEADLMEFYNILLSGRTYDTFPNHPVTTEGRGIMSVGGTEQLAKDMASLIKNNQEWQRLEIGATERLTSFLEPGQCSTVSEARGVQKPKASLPLNQIRRPLAWTKKGLADFVWSVTTSRPPTVLRQGVHHKDVVEYILLELLFKSPDIRPMLSWTALHQTLSFLVKHQKTWAANQHLGHMERHGFMPNVETFNILIRGCAREQNMLAFNHFLNLMNIKGIVPNEGTWTALTSAAPDLESQKTIAREIFKRGFEVQPAFARENAPQIIPYSFGPFLDAGGTTSEYTKTLDDLYGPNWVCPAAVNELVATLAAHGQFIEAIELVKHFSQHQHYKPTTGVVHILLRHCARNGNADLAIWLVVYCHRTWGTRTDDHIIQELLFKIASRARMPNTLRVIWKYTNANGEATFHMRRWIHHSLTQRMKPAPETVQGRWQSIAGSVACGEDPLAKGSSGTPGDIIAREKRLYGRKPVFSFTLKLVQALLLDKEWSADAVKKTRGTTWMLRNAIGVPFRPVALAAPVLKKIAGDSKLVGRVRRFASQSKLGGGSIREVLAMRGTKADGGEEMRGKSEQDGGGL